MAAACRAIPSGDVLCCAGASKSARRATTRGRQCGEVALRVLWYTGGRPPRSWPHHCPLGTACGGTEAGAGRKARPCGTRERSRRWRASSGSLESVVSVSVCGVETGVVAG